MDSQGFGAIPERPADPRIQHAPQVGQDINQFAQASASHTGYPSAPPTLPRVPVQRPANAKSRAEVLELRRLERETGVDFFLPNTKMTVRVRDLPFTDRTMLRGVPPDMRTKIEQAVEITQSFDQGLSSISAALSLMDADADLSDGVCIAGWIWPRLARSEQERQTIIRDEGLTEDDVYLVGDFHPDEKAKYRDWAFRDRDGAQEDTARLATFPSPRMEEAPDSQASPSPETVPVSAPPDGGERLLA